MNWSIFTPDKPVGRLLEVTIHKLDFPDGKSHLVFHKPWKVDLRIDAECKKIYAFGTNIGLCAFIEYEDFEAEKEDCKARIYKEIELEFCELWTKHVEGADFSRTNTGKKKKGILRRHDELTGLVQLVKLARKET